ncbi:MAG TPA: glycosyltransferase family 39 protein [Thermoanaerobaculaceae bacterium]|nr:glycosyltransferase family 39 protein [Thermoanaerobaculaceae bacterium]HPS76715.1 glycosyltransferase family 39 protein [Thermoanaerobaculaceae bacterium]
MIPLPRRSWLALVVPGTFALVLRTAAAGTRPPWHDEYFTAWASRLSWSDLLAALRLDSGPPLLYVLTHAVSALGFPPLAAARSLAVLSGVATVLLTVLAARRLWGNGAAWVAGLLLASHPLAVHWGSEARAYGLLLAAGAWAWERMSRLTADGRGSWGLGLAVALGCWAHSLGVILAGAFGVCCLLLPQPARRPGLLAVAAGLASHLPWMPVMTTQPTAAIAWMGSLWESLPIPPSRLLAILRYLPETAAFGGVLDLPSPPLTVELAGAAMAVALLVLAGRGASHVWLLAPGIVLPVLGFWLLASLGVPVFYPGRTQAAFLLPFLLLLAAAPGRLARVLGLGLATAGLVVSTLALLAWAAAPPSAEKLLALAVRDRLPAGGQVVVGGAWRLGVAFQLQNSGSRVEPVSYPTAAAAHPGWYVSGYDHPAPGELEALATRLAARPAAVIVAPGADTAGDLRRLAGRLGLRSLPVTPVVELWVPAGLP